eukprot:gene18851-17306_t
MLLQLRSHVPAVAAVGVGTGAPDVHVASAVQQAVTLGSAKVALRSRNKCNPPSLFISMIVVVLLASTVSATSPAQTLLSGAVSNTTTITRSPHPTWSLADAWFVVAPFFTITLGIVGLLIFM